MTVIHCICVQAKMSYVLYLMYQYRLILKSFDPASIILVEMID